MHRVYYWIVTVQHRTHKTPFDKVESSFILSSSSSPRENAKRVAERIRRDAQRGSGASLEFLYVDFIVSRGRHDEYEAGYLVDHRGRRYGQSIDFLLEKTGRR